MRSAHSTTSERAIFASSLSLFLFLSFSVYCVLVFLIAVSLSLSLGFSCAGARQGADVKCMCVVETGAEKTRCFELRAFRVSMLAVAGSKASLRCYQCSQSREDSCTMRHDTGDIFL